MNLQPKDNRCSDFAMFLTSLFLKTINFSDLGEDLG